MSQMPGALQARHFVGRIEQLAFHNDAVGLWNMADAASSEGVEGAAKESALSTGDEGAGESSETGITSSQACNCRATATCSSSRAAGTRAAT